MSKCELYLKKKKRNNCLTINLGSGDESNSSTSEKHTLSRKEVIRRLRDRGEPITLFGESELDSFKRLRRSELAEPESNKVCL